LIKMRSPLNALKWDGDWGPSSKLWEPKLKQAIGDQHFQVSGALDEQG